ncbi:U1 small nuclear ribonucleoprotein C-like isoform X1 [Olea europaea var. sylvestris]|uniref:U1 small nuclear ribonucleoprotein C-like isoform X1 n=1 Tax=Olea europaea var. sylvestris TaxID=158386 RepID=UPI000C1D1405|nr:U1 small nuclear ribonucleoprotein C-like isoform X1 [Olea europaea var. sylvestris]XP_022849791.1 U1 small nuclear ribonucleoprotein C-like isoform X1 [Olea europaea var. sylvestris]XP_022849832.1 U1 small nuclear ribonucleoprotein C-like isoform X1 [Olea europaea var. sylvestris]XP_022849866.1 U1 small nuclear ribonucleoprotein C-like isoform X1 [Olea europaea var. sylvestris]
MATPSGPRPGNIPPIYTPNSLANNMQDLQINQPNLQQPKNPTGGASRPPITLPFGQQPPPFAGTRPGPPLPSAFTGGPGLPSPSGPPNTLSPNVASTRPTGPPPGSQPSPRFTLRPLPPGLLPSSMGAATVSVASGSSPQLGPGPHQQPYVSSGLMSGPAVPPPLSTSGPLSNGLSRITTAQPQDGPRFPPVMGSTPQPPPIAAPQQARILSSGSSSQHPQLWDRCDTS